MDKASPDDRGREGRLDNLIAEHLEAVEAGRPPDREAWLAQGPDLADDQRAFLAAHDQMAQVGAPLRALASAEPRSPRRRTWLPVKRLSKGSDPENGFSRDPVRSFFGSKPFTGSDPLDLGISR